MRCIALQCLTCFACDKPLSRSTWALLRENDSRRGAYDGTASLLVVSVSIGADGPVCSTRAATRADGASSRLADEGADSCGAGSSVSMGDSAAITARAAAGPGVRTDGIRFSPDGRLVLRLAEEEAFRSASCPPTWAARSSVGSPSSNLVILGGLGAINVPVVPAAGTSLSSAAMLGTRKSGKVCMHRIHTKVKATCLTMQSCDPWQ